MEQEDAADLEHGVGVGRTEWPERTTSSEETPSMWALRYCTTPSLPSSGGPSPRTAMIECAGMPGATGIAASAVIRGAPGVMP